MATEYIIIKNDKSFKRMSLAFALLRQAEELQKVCGDKDGPYFIPLSLASIAAQLQGNDWSHVIYNVDHQVFNIS